MLNPNYIANPHMLGENRLPQRSMLLPAAKRGVTHQNLSDSDRVQLLNGIWKFNYLPADTIDPLWDEALDDNGWDDLPVPSMWQFQGYGTCLYPNVRYCFPYDPPYIHRDNPVGFYRRRFTAKKAGRMFLRFLGVDNAYFVWLNGVYVGFSKGSRLAAEFDVTDLVRDGENLLAVKVYTYSDASYLENQDMLMASGIFRDVSLISCGESYLWDYTLLPEEGGFRLFTECRGASNAQLHMALYDADGALVYEREDAASESGEAFLPVENPHLWNAEDPYLYELVMTLTADGMEPEVHTKKAGLRFTSIEGSSLLINGKPITLKGVNRHENNAKTGRTLSIEQIRSELQDIKDCNLNAIRCSHYTNHPAFYEIASELGIYVMDEADLETHGAEATGDQGVLNKDPEWFDAFFDRISRMYWQNKNETCINIWSVGNECGVGENHDRCAAWLKEQKVIKPVRLEPSAAATLGGDFRLTGYMSMDTLRGFEPEGKPVMMLEYAHAMGNSPGGLEDIWNYVYTHDFICGGYVWEYKSHGFLTEGIDGKPRYLYGGDFPDLYHWSNFSLDGFHTSDGTPKPTWHELREISAPIFVLPWEGGITVRNTNDFTALEGVTMRWTLASDAKTVREGELTLPRIEPRSNVNLPLPLCAKGCRGLVTADFVFTANDRQLAHKQLVLTKPSPAVIERVPYAHTVTTDAYGSVTIVGDDFTVTFAEGMPAALERGGRAVITAPMKLNLWRAPTDNDGITGFAPRRAGIWKGSLVDQTCYGHYSCRVEDAEDCVTITSTGKLLPQSHWWGFDMTLIYRVTAGGRIDVTMEGKPYGKPPEILPRIGVMLTLPEDADRAAWVGRGPGDSYPDRKALATVGSYDRPIAELNFLYDVPQETGSHEDTRWVKIYSSASGEGVRVSAPGVFAFSCHDFTLENLTAARHCDELVHTNTKYLYIDYRQEGIGSNSCGPVPEKEYELRTSEFEFEFTIE
ncbi:MAG: hypothetical protein IJ493_03205 [Clostridia bacterium]|nr:hypothetical protein [Clostridia bacterium]